MALYKAREYKIKQREDASEPELGSLEAFLNPPPHTEAVELDKTELDEAVDSQWELTSGESSSIVSSPRDSPGTNCNNAGLERGKWRRLKKELCPQLTGYKYGKYNGYDTRRLRSEEESLSRKRKTQLLLIKAG
ncbi:hypothetical protein Pmar_PMAR013724 [Perkinsus marinus ATCC 50983]|uniref:Uncharacterized protein n=1 Tax=Perkinsus marinus (strain ATCC 50983 / TXsc) TaxID=423536 RepID=C5LY45_PERM5|nr:hypothetical protein Pmar_PMAR013724 [Perkinsus marinus ATCC 50983]EEQ98375.1 hypothetical protein Pmar_PMAR013724 [Perkinsus marinus ATCC 50983]|eukprot:XP_002765658.1 hypothetical protein Pmar_PMAR013724 [Perkinsus marinus ATCC 50983]